MVPFLVSVTIMDQPLLDVMNLEDNVHVRRMSLEEDVNAVEHHFMDFQNVNHAIVLQLLCVMRIQVNKS